MGFIHYQHDCNSLVYIYIWELRCFMIFTFFYLKTGLSSNETVSKYSKGSKEQLVPLQLWDLSIKLCQILEKFFIMVGGGLWHLIIWHFRLCLRFVWFTYGQFRIIVCFAWWKGERKEIMNLQPFEVGYMKKKQKAISSE